MNIKNLKNKVNKKARNNIKNNKNGITLIALVVTIIVLIILAGISISLVLGNNGIITKARDARENFMKAVDEEGTKLNELYAEMNEKISGTSNPGGQGGGEEPQKGPTGKPLINQETISELTTSKVTGEDKLGNQIVIPEGFKLAQGTNGSGETVKEGIVIEDDERNQYVWVPVSNINHDGTGKIKVNSADEEGVEITLGRYTFDSNSPGNPTLATNSYQYASSYATPVTIQSYFQELTTYRQSNYSSGTDETNTTARGVMESGSFNGIKGFIDSVAANKGYYVARYEASYRANGKAGSIESTSTDDTLALTSAPATRTAGDLWNFVKQGEAAEACYGLYTTVNSDLMNSYAWDTAIVYIQSMSEENINYANKKKGGGTRLLNTGTTKDEKCKIFDMAGNAYEWTTEYSFITNNLGANPYVYRGSSYNSSLKTMSRQYSSGGKVNYISFRSVLW